MIGKIVKGTSFSECVNYVLKEDKSRLLKAVGVYGLPEEIAEQFELQTLLNDKVKNKVGHISSPGIPTVTIRIVISFTTGWIMTAAPSATRTTATEMKKFARC